MPNIVLKSTLVASTGTGITLQPWNLLGPKAEFVDLAPVGGVNPLRVNLTRTDATPTKAYEGANKAQLRVSLPQVHPTSGVVWPQVATVSFSHPGFLTLAQRQSFETSVLLILTDPAFRSFTAEGVVPQS